MVGTRGASATIHGPHSHTRRQIPRWKTPPPTSLRCPRAAVHGPSPAGPTQRLAAALETSHVTQGNTAHTEHWAQPQPVLPRAPRHHSAASCSADATAAASGPPRTAFQPPPRRADWETTAPRVSNHARTHTHTHTYTPGSAELPQHPLRSPQGQHVDTSSCCCNPPGGHQRTLPPW